jgi:hypothetical protein
MARWVVRDALEQLREGGCLVQMHVRNGTKWFVIPDAGRGSSQPQALSRSDGPYGQACS